MRVRMIKPEFWSNEQLGACDAITALMYIGLWGMSDRRGILRDRPAHIRATLFPYKVFDAEPHLAELCRLGLIKRYVAEGVHCIKIPTFVRHQHFHHREKPSSLPDIDAPKASPVIPPGQPEASPTDSAIGFRYTASRDEPEKPGAGKPKRKLGPPAFGQGSETQAEANAKFYARMKELGLSEVAQEGQQTKQ